MVVLSKIYTKTGDAGETALGNGARVAKHSIRVSAYGTVDETNATVGLARLHATGEHGRGADAHLERPLRSWGRPLHARHGTWTTTLAIRRCGCIEGQVQRLEREIDAMNAQAARRCAASSCRAARRWRRSCTSAAPSAAAPNG